MKLNVGTWGEESIPYIRGGTKLGALEIGPTKDNTREFKDGMLKLPFFLKDILANILNHHPKLLRKRHALGYNINGMYGATISNISNIIAKFDVYASAK